MKKTKKTHHNVTVAKNRGESWKKNLLRGRLEANQNPTNLRLTRIKKSLSQEELAKSLKLGTSTFGSIEKGIRLVKKERAKEIAKELGRSLSHLFTLDKETNKYKAKLSAG